MTTNEPEVVSLRQHFEDFEQTIKMLDTVIFSPHEHPPAAVIFCPEYPAEGIPGERVGTVASFTQRLTLINKSPGIFEFPKSREGYVIWQKGTERKISFLRRHPNFSGAGDALLKDFWLLAAVSLVRARVLYRSHWFSGVGLRTIESMAKHVGVFGEDGFCALRKLPDELASELTVASPTELDMQLTQRLFVAAVTHGVTREEAFTFLTTN